MASGQAPLGAVMGRTRKKRKGVMLLVYRSTQFVDKILSLPNHLIKNFHLRNHFGEFFTFGIISVGFHEINFHLQNHFGKFVNFGTISVGCHEIDFSPSESFR
jgi:hypothetical protein